MPGVSHPKKSPPCKCQGYPIPEKSPPCHYPGYPIPGRSIPGAYHPRKFPPVTARGIPSLELHARGTHTRSPLPGIFPGTHPQESSPPIPPEVHLITGIRPSFAKGLLLRYLYVPSHSAGDPHPVQSGVSHPSGDLSNSLTPAVRPPHIHIRPLPQSHPHPVRCCHPAALSWIASPLYGLPRLYTKKIMLLPQCILSSKKKLM